MSFCKTYKVSFHSDELNLRYFFVKINLQNSGSKMCLIKLIDTKTILKTINVMSVNKHYKEVKKLIRKSNLPDSYFASKYGFSPYMACEHSCKYCDGRAEKYYVEGDFEKDIIIRKNLPDLLQKELPKLREKGFFSIGSGISDAYQPIEKEEKLMRRAAEIMGENDFAVSIMTKSNLVLRDIDLWEKVNKNNRFLLMVSLTFTDDKQRKIFEPNTASVEERLEMLKAFKERGMYTGVLAMPFIPHISDNEKNIRALFEKLKEINIDFIMPGGLTLRPGIQKGGFLKIIEENFPQYLDNLKSLYIENRASGAAFPKYYSGLHSITDSILEELKIPQVIPHYIYKDQFPIYDEVFILMKHLFELYRSKKLEVRRLTRAFKSYAHWLAEEKKVFNRRRRITQRDLEDKLMAMFVSSEFSKMTGNPKLADFLYRIVSERLIFDYVKKDITSVNSY